MIFEALGFAPHKVEPSSCMLSNNAVSNDHNDLALCVMATSFLSSNFIRQWSISSPLKRFWGWGDCA